MIKRYVKFGVLLGAVLSLTGVLLSGCTSTQSGNLSSGSQTPAAQGGSATQSATSSGSADARPDLVLSSADGQSGTTNQTSQPSTSQNAQNTTQPQTSAASGTADRGDIVTYDEQHQNGAEDDTPSVYDADADDDDSSDTLQGVDQFTGSFSKEDDSESVTLSLDNDTDLSFSFASCGIHGNAQVSGQTAVYTGDDDYTITFSVSGDVLRVTVGGDDASQSAINGTYYRESETEADEG